MLQEMKMLRVPNGGDPAHNYNHGQIQDATHLNVSATSGDEQVCDGNWARDHTAETAISLKELGEDMGYVLVPYRKPETFMDLPCEIRRDIYHILFRPDAAWYQTCTHWRNALGCTKVLVLSLAIRADAVRVLESMNHTLHFHGRGRRVFRSMFAHGTPKMFKSFSQTTSCHIPQVLTELAFLRLRKLVVDFKYVPKVQGYDGEEHYDDDGKEVLGGLRKEMADLRKAVTKSKALVRLHFEIQTRRWREIYPSKREEVSKADPVVNDDNHELVDMFLPLIVAAARQAFTLTATENQDFYERSDYIPSTIPLHAEDYRDPLVQFINDAAAAGHDDAAPPLEPALPLLFTGKPQGPLKDEFTNPFECIDYPPIEYSLIPECRKCYETFRDRGELDRHLATHPKHKIPFAKKRYNGLSKKYATTTSWRHKCRVCGQGFDTVAAMEEHCERSKHQRTREQGIVGRWKNDNSWYRYPGGRRRGHTAEEGMAVV